jgi:hypothetical protein
MARPFWDARDQADHAHRSCARFSVRDASHWAVPIPARVLRTGCMSQNAGPVSHGPMPPIRVIEYRTMKPGSDPSGAGTSASGET